MSLTFIFGFILNILVLVQTNFTSNNIKLIKNIRPNFDGVKGLICYQCSALSTDPQPLCDKTIFALSTEEEKYNMSLQCPYYQDAFCFTRVVRKGKAVETTRGCSKLRDRIGNKMKVGCITVKDAVLCLCDKKFCNRATPHSRIFHLIMQSAFILILLHLL